MIILNNTKLQSVDLQEYLMLIIEAVTTSFSMGRFSTLTELTTLYLYHQNNTIDRTIYRSNQKTINTVMSMQH